MKTSIKALLRHTFNASSFQRYEVNENSTEFGRTNDTARDVIITPIDRASNFSTIMINLGSELDEMRYELWFSDSELQHEQPVTNDVFYIQNTTGQCTNIISSVTYMYM